MKQKSASNSLTFFAILAEFKFSGSTNIVLLLLKTCLADKGP